MVRQAGTVTGKRQRIRAGEGMNSIFRRIAFLAAAVTVLAGLVMASVWIYHRALPAPLPHPGVTVFRPPHEVSSLAIWKGKLWAGGRDGLSALDMESGEIQTIPKPDVPLRYVTSLLAQEGKGLWIGHPEGLTLFDGKGYRTFTEKDGLPDRRVNCLLMDRTGTLWVGTWKGAVAFNRSPKKVLNRKSGLADDMVRVMMQDRDGRLWFGSYVAPAGGLSVPSADGWKVFNRHNGLPHNNVTSICQDDKGDIWVGTGLLDRGGCSVFKYSGGRWNLENTLTKRDGLAGEKVRTIFQDSKLRYWITSEYDGILLTKRSTRSILKERNGLSSNEVKVVMEDSTGRIWMGTRDGVTRIDASFSIH